MKKLYIDDILHKSDLSQPGPGKYELKDSFGKNKGLEYSMGAKLRVYERSFDISKRMPGPG